MRYTSEMDVCISWCTNEGLGDRRGENLAITIAECQRTQSQQLLPTTEDLGINTVLLAANCAGTGPPSSTYFFALNKNWEPSPPAHLQRLVGIPSGPGADSFFCGHHFIKFLSISLPLYIIWSRLNVPQNGLVAMVPFASRASKIFPNRCIIQCQIRLHSPGGNRLCQ